LVTKVAEAVTAAQAIRKRRQAKHDPRMKRRSLKARQVVENTRKERPGGKKPQ
jgi:hypothetical protein